MAAEAFADGTLQVGEVSHGGSVPNLLVANGGDKPVLIVDGEELVGAKQNRILNTTVLVREKSELVVPVSCVEAGRWHYQGPAFHDEEYVVHPNVRRKVHETVGANLAAGLAFASDQGAVWDEVADLQGYAPKRSATGAHRDVYVQRKDEIGEYLAAFPLLDGQHGLLVLRGGEVVGLDFVSRSAGFAQLHAKLVRSYAFDAVTYRMDRERRGEKAGNGKGGVSAKTAAGRAAAFLEAIGRLQGRSFKSPGRGWDVRYAGPRVVGSALVVRETAVHGAFFAITDGGGSRRGPQGDPRMAGLEWRRGNRAGSAELTRGAWSGRPRRDPAMFGGRALADAAATARHARLAVNWPCHPSRLGRRMSTGHSGGGHERSAARQAQEGRHPRDLEERGYRLHAVAGRTREHRSARRHDRHGARG